MAQRQGVAQLARMLRAHPVRPFASRPPPAAAAAQVLCTTSTLALGVNLPARLVVIKGTRRYVGSEAEDKNGYQEYERSTCLQARGRRVGADRVAGCAHSDALSPERGCRRYVVAADGGARRAAAI